MRTGFIGLAVILVAIGCSNNNNIPDVSGVKVELKTLRFDKDLFSLDTAGNFTARLDSLIAKYPSFGENYISTILGIDPKVADDSVAQYVKGFIKAYKTVYDSSTAVFKSFEPYEKEVKKAFQFVKYYFPDYKTPPYLITFIGPLNGYGSISTDDAIVIGLQHHLGKNFSLYKTDLVQEVYPEYVSRRFEPDYVTINSMQLVGGELYQEKLEDKPLAEQMVEKGKSLYLLQKILPYTAENKLIGYTEQQMKMCYANETKIWSLFTQNNLLQTIDNNLIRNYIGESPKTQELADDEGNFAPGNIGSFAGWQIIKKYMAKNPDTKLPDLLQMDAAFIFEKAKYKP